MPASICDTDVSQPADATIESTWPGYLRTFKAEVVNSFLLEHICSGRHFYGTDTDGGGVNLVVDVGGASGLAGAPYAGLLVKVLPIVDNTGSGTLTVKTSTVTIAAGPIKFGGANIAAGLIVAGRWLTVVWDGTNWQILSGFDVEVAITSIVINIINTQLSGGIVASTRASTSAMATTTSTIPFDNTKPQKTEGTEILTVTHTPKSATNKLRIIVDIQWSIASTANVMIGALFKGTDSDALAAVFAGLEISTTHDNVHKSTMVYEMTAGVTTALTFKLRVGSDDGTQVTINGYEGAAKFNGVLETGITVEEIGV